MKKLTMVLIAMMLLILCPVGRGATLTPKILGNDMAVKGWLGVGDPNAGSLGPLLGWSPDDDDAIWLAGMRAEQERLNVARASGVRAERPAPQP